MLTRTPIALAMVTLILNAAVVWLVASGEGRLLTLAFYLAGLGTGIAAIWLHSPNRSRKKRAASIERGDLPLIGGIMLVQLLGLIYMSTFTFHYVQDEFITGYTSYTLPAITEIEWFAAYPAPGEWIAGFPILYYALQKPFIELFGLSLETVRFSTWPYHLLSAALVYLIGKEFFQARLWAVVATLIYIVLAPNLYMAGYGMHNISSTFFFLAAFYAAIRMLREESRGWAIVCGLFATMSYLTYTSSYLTLPLLGILVVLWALFNRSYRPLVQFGPVLVVVVIGLLPFITSAVTGHNFFTERGDQVNALSAFYDDEDVENPNAELVDHIWTNIQSLYTPGIGGVTDYWFGHQALFDWMTLTLLVVGLGIALYRRIRYWNAIALTGVATVLATYTFGMLLTLPAGGFHRTSLAFPFVAIFIALAIRALVESVPRLRSIPRFQPVAAGAILLALILINLSTLQSMVHADEEISGLTDSVPITAFIESQVSEGETVIVSAFPNYHLERELIVRTGDTYDVQLAAFDEAIEQAGETVIILFQPPSDQIHRLEARYGGGEFVDSYGGRELQRHLIWVPESLARH